MKSCLSCLAVLVTLLLPLPAGAGVSAPCNWSAPVTASSAPASRAPSGAVLAGVRQFATTWQPVATAAGPAVTDADGPLTAPALAERLARYAELPDSGMQTQPGAGAALAAAADCTAGDGPEPPAT